jgi:hypothetical protein
MNQAAACEQLDLFYLGREVDDQDEQGISLPLLVKHQDLTTHAAIIGMTGSGKTGLGIDLLEEAALDGIPALVIDPKGDMGNLLLGFPDLKPDDFLPWIDPATAQQQGIDPQELARRTARRWQDGLKQWDQDGERIRRMQERTEFALYTPGNRSGRPLSVLEGLTAPAPEVLIDQEGATQLAQSVVSSLLGLLGLDLDPLTSREHILLSMVLLTAWQDGRDVTLPSLIALVVQPPFSMVGVFPLESFCPRKERMDLAMRLNAILASPAFSGWLEGEPLDIESLLWTSSGGPRISICSLAHLDDRQRMFFVTLVLGRLIDWVRRQEGRSGLRCLLYMDEIFGYFPPVGQPPSKQPMLLLLKQARAYGLGIVLATQNPVDLDYRGLANIGTWLLGRLQTKQDQERILSGLAGGLTGEARQMVAQELATMRSRQFLLYSTRRDHPVRFEARWAMSYLRGPLSLEEIHALQGKHVPPQQATARQQPADRKASAIEAHQTAPILPPALPQLYAPPPLPMASPLLLPWLLGSARVGFHDQRRGIEEQQQICLRLPLDGSVQLEWHLATPCLLDRTALDKTPPQGARFAPIQGDLSPFSKERKPSADLAEYLYQSRRLILYRLPELHLESRPGEEQAQFRTRIEGRLAEEKAKALAEVEHRYGTKLHKLEQQLAKAMARVDKEQADVRARGLDAAVSIGVAVFGALFGRKPLSVSSASRAGQGVRSAGRVAKERGDVERARQEVQRLQAEFDRVNGELQDKLAQVRADHATDRFPCQEFQLKPRRQDITGVELAVLWEPKLT